MWSQNNKPQDFAKRVIRSGNLAIGLSPKCLKDLGYVSVLHIMFSNPYCACFEKFSVIFWLQNLEVTRRLTCLLLVQFNNYIAYIAADETYERSAGCLESIG
jgi:hypothetical protein